MPPANFCVECGERLARSGWRARLGGRLCPECSQRLGTSVVLRPLFVVALVAVIAFALGRYLRPAAPPLIIQRAANSSLLDSPVGVDGLSRPNANAASNQKQFTASTNEEGYMCGARTKKGAPCKRRVHAAGERCFQNRGLPAMVPVEKLVIKPRNSNMP